jgi:hypothetical protein
VILRRSNVDIFTATVHELFRCVEKNDAVDFLSEKIFEKIFGDR